jgi:hypothetical protein
MEEDVSEDPGIDWRIILRSGRVWTELILLGTVITRLCEGSNKVAVSVKCRKFVDLLSCLRNTASWRWCEENESWGFGLVQMQVLVADVWPGEINRTRLKMHRVT